MPAIGLLKSALRAYTFRKGINVAALYISYLLSRISGKAQHWGMPTTVSIEPTTSCNLGCTQCPSGLRQFTRPTGSLDMGLLSKTIDQLSRNLLHLILYFQGEPYLNPHFFHFVEYARENRIFTSTSTNAHFLTEKHAEKTVLCGLDKIIISMDGMDQKTYSDYRVGGDLEKVKVGIQNLVNAKQKLKSKTPFIELQFIVFSTNEHQIPDIKAFAKQSGVDRLVFKSAQIYDFKESHFLIPKESKHARYAQDENGKWVIKSKLPNRCFRMWQGCVITWDGKVVPCCFDKDASHQLGDMQEESFNEIWRGQEYRSFRQQIFKQRKSVDICSNCTEGLKSRP